MFIKKKINTFQIYLLKRLNRVLDCVEKKALGVYYSMPWERSADLFGGVKRTTVYLPYIDAISYLYLANVKLSPYPDYFYGGSIHLP